MIEFSATTHPGNRYQHNEDAIGWNEEAGLWFVADGIGGHARGDLASATVKASLLDAADEPERSLTDLVLRAHDAVIRESREQSASNMGSTVVLARIRENKLNVAWCGDSRAYLWRAGRLTRLTKDHSLLEQLLESGIVAPEEAFGHPRRNVLVQALGISDPPPKPSEISLTLDNNDLVLLCSDGVHDELHDNTIADVLAAMSTSVTVPIQALVDEIERRVLTTDARDNLSLICLKAVNLALGETAAGAVPELTPVADGLQTIKRMPAATSQRKVETQKLDPQPIDLASGSSRQREASSPPNAERAAKPSASRNRRVVLSCLAAAALLSMGWAIAWALGWPI